MKWLILAFAAVFAANPDGPVLPDQFTAQWNAKSFWDELHYSSGKLEYNWNNGVDSAMHWHYIDGWAEPYCWQSAGMTTDNQCHHYVTNSTLYLYVYKGDIDITCCKCCTAAQGCGVPPPDFMKTAAFLGSANQRYSWNFNDQFHYIETEDPEPELRSWTEMTSPRVNFTNVWDFKATVELDNLKLPGVCEGAGECQAGPCEVRRAHDCASLPKYFF